MDKIFVEKWRDQCLNKIGEMNDIDPATKQLFAIIIQATAYNYTKDSEVTL
jgi:hypothetical protein